MAPPLFKLLKRNIRIIKESIKYMPQVSAHEEGEEGGEERREKEEVIPLLLRFKTPPFFPFRWSRL